MLVASEPFQSHCMEVDTRQSMGGVGDWYRNAIAESWFSSFNREVLPDGSYLSSAEARRRVIDTHEGRYDSLRSHSVLG